MENIKINFFFSGDSYFHTALDSIEKSQEEILIESYIFEYDPIGIQFLNALKKAKDRNVQIKILVDGVGSYNSVRQIHSFCQENKIEFRIYHPIPFELKIIRFLSWRNLQRILTVFRKINKRLHRKTIIIDRQTVFLGSCNISQVHSSHYMGLKSWRDTSVKLDIEKKSVDLQNIIYCFFKAWRQSRKPLFPMLISRRKEKEPTSNHNFSLFRLNHRQRWRFFLQRDLKKRIRSAKQRIYITNAYFLPRKSLLSHLTKAARRGVDVQILIPSKSDVSIFNWAQRALYYQILYSGIKVYEYTPSMMHAKTLIIDNWATIGSHNFNHRSFIHDLESDVVISQPTDIEILIKQDQIDKRNSKEVKLHNYLDIHPIELFFHRFIYWLRYWL